MARQRKSYITYMQARINARNEGIAINEARGIAIGKRKDVTKTLVVLVKDGVLSIKNASKRAKMTEQEFVPLLTVQERHHQKPAEDSLRISSSPPSVSEKGGRGLLMGWGQTYASPTLSFILQQQKPLRQPETVPRFIHGFNALPPQLPA